MVRKPTKPERLQTCRCTSHKCDTHRMVNLAGLVVKGRELSRAAYRKHQLDEVLANRAAERRGNFGANRTGDRSDSGEHESQNNNVASQPPEAGHHEAEDAGPHATEVPESRPPEGAFVDCSSFYSTKVEQSHPIVIHSILTAAILATLGHASQHMMSWLLRVTKAGLRLATQGLNKNSSVRRAVELIPGDIRTAISWLNIEPKTLRSTCCPSCFATYEVDTSPSLCPAVVDTQNNETSSESEILCGEPLLRDNGRPLRECAFQDLDVWIGRLLARPGMEDLLDESLEASRTPWDPTNNVRDIHDSRAWKEFKGPDGTQFTSKSGNLAFGMFTDGINPYGNKKGGKKVSITFITMVCLNLPYAVRNLPENVFLVGIAPGPKEPKIDQVNSILRPIVDQLKTLWTGTYLSQTSRHPQGRLVRAALFLFCADLIALRRTLGFPAIRHTFLCSMCLLTKHDITNLDPESWPRRTIEEHLHWAFRARDTHSVTQHKKILDEHGVRYSVLTELDYWNIIDYHVVDSMHNLLLGLFHWHCRDAWAMHDVKDDDEVAIPIPRAELMDVQIDATRIQNAPYLPAPAPSTDPDPLATEFNILTWACHTDSSASDPDYEPDHEVPLDGGWDGRWTKPAPEQIVMDKTLLAHVNALLPRIRTPSWIRRAVPCLGKESYGALKADEWRNLFTVQLVLSLVPLWNSVDQVELSLLQNFQHLVSLVNLALKRRTNESRIRAYREHLQKYLEGTIQLFEHLELRPNHHMAWHVADGLQRFGPVRSWWCFPSERLMGLILKHCHNNKTGQLELTFMDMFCRGANLRAHLDAGKVPSGLEPYLFTLQSFYAPVTPPISADYSTQRLSSLESSVHSLLILTLNQEAEQTHGYKWVSSADLAALDDPDPRKVGPLSSQAEQLGSIDIDGVRYTTHARNVSDSVITFWSELDSRRRQIFGEIVTIFRHWRDLPTQSGVCETFLCVSSYSEVQGTINPFKKPHFPEVQGHLCYDLPRQCVLIRASQVIAHCAYIKYGQGECSELITSDTIALVNLDRN